MRRSVCRGTPQGGVLSPLLWNLAMNKLLLDLEERRIKVVAYADDVAILIRGKFPDTLCSLMHRTLKYVDTWAKTCGLSLNAAKTELVLFTRKYKIPDCRPLTLNGTLLLVGEKARYLGLTLDRKLSWKLNVQERIKKAATALYSCKRTVGLKWGLAPKIVHWLYTAIVRPIMTYGVLVWWPSLDKKTSIKKLDSIQRAASLSITGALKTTPTSALSVMLHLLPIDLYCRQLAAKAALRLRESSMLKTNKWGHSRILGMFPGIPNTTDFCDSVNTYLDRPYTVHFPSREEWVNGLTNNENGVSIYTDGSKLNDQVGGGVYSETIFANLSFRLPDHCSVFQAEILAISESLLMLNKSVVTVRDIFIYSDSQAALKSLLSSKHSSKTVKECYKLLTTLAQYFSINLLWVPGHSNIIGNCKADELARLGSSLQISQDRLDIPMPLATCKLLIDRYTISAANSNWRQLNTCAISRLAWPEWNMGPTKSLLKLVRSAETKEKITTCIPNCNKTQCNTKQHHATGYGYGGNQNSIGHGYGYDYAPTSTARSPNQEFATQSADVCNLTTSQLAARQCVPKDLLVSSDNAQE
ncbi:uncharacterized protein LOC128869891 [Anastrepha ludens]|uniref:uncharacterized protein LOC128869891 n=1 Tax=Anastrepha ludens TaxID=28586 RepID=UPI0023B14897|nr:uncharacterized protein LOC128869891 [Anastrepha ludens]